MLYLTLIADDFTGAIDTSIQFAQYGLQTDIFIYMDNDEPIPLDSATEILVIDAETRHSDFQETYDRFRRIAEQLKKREMLCLYIKTDSALRGEIGNMIKAVMDEYNKSFLAFIPAFPESGRITKDGIQYIDGIPVTESVFGSDLFDPVTSSRVSDHFTKYNICTKDVAIGEECAFQNQNVTVAIFDAVENRDLKSISAYLKNSGHISIVAGCAGFARVLPETLGFPSRRHEIKIPGNPFIVICGSLNPVTRNQIEYAETIGFERFILTPEQIYKTEYLNGNDGLQWYEEFLSALDTDKNVILDTGISTHNKYLDHLDDMGILLDKARLIIADFLGMLISRLINEGKMTRRLLMIIGGDTFLGFYNKTGCSKITPLLELDSGTVLSSCRISDFDYPVISKSGGLGKDSLFYDLINQQGERSNNE